MRSDLAVAALEPSISASFDGLKAITSLLDGSACRNGEDIAFNLPKYLVRHTPEQKAFQPAITARSDDEKIRL